MPARNEDDNMTAAATSPSYPASRSVADFVIGTAPGALPPGVLHEAKRSLLNFVACGVSVAYSPVVETAVRVLEPFTGPRTHTLIGRHERLDPLSATFINAVSANLLDYDDTHLRTVIHPTAPVAPVALALAETRPLSGAHVLTAFALGAEIECRIGNMVTGGHYARGWHITTTCGVYGAAVAAGYLLGLSSEKLAHALGIAASQSAGVVENLPTEAKNVGMGNAARGGMLAALFAEAGYDSAPRAIDGPLGWARAAGDEPRLDELLGGLGSRWELLKNTYKPYPAGIVMHAIIEACLELKAQHAIAASAIESVTVSGDALLLARGDRAVRNERDARVSIHHSVAAPFLWGAFGVRELDPERVMSPEAIALRENVMAERDDSIPQGGARVVVRMADGSRHEKTVLHARGSIQAPLSDGELEEKVRSLVGLAGTGLDAEKIIAGVWGLDEAPGVTALLAATVARVP
jgi:2-methylcitrate dehydratase PrpD